MPNDIHSQEDFTARPVRAVHGRVRRVAGRFLLMVLLLVLLAAMGAALLRVSDDARLLFQVVARYSVFAYAGQLAATVCLWLGWNKVVAWLVSRGLVPAHARPALIRRRGRWCAALFTLQVILLASAVHWPA